MSAQRTPELALFAAVLLVGCSAPQRSNPYDQKACEPACTSEKEICRKGKCIENPCPLERMVFIDEGPETKRSPFCIARYEASIDSDGKATWGPNEPKSAIFPEQAELACRKAGAVLCNDLQWRDACTGRISDDDDGNEPNPDDCNLGGNSLKDTGGSERCEGGYTGLFDMLGNLAEWTINSKDSVHGLVPATWVSGGHYRDNTASCGEPEEVGTKNILAPETAGFRCCVPCPRDQQDKDQVTCVVTPSWLLYPIRGVDQDDLSSPGHRMWGTSPSDLWMVSAPVGDGWVAHFDGEIWTRVSEADMNVSGFPAGVWGTGPNDVWIIKGNELLSYNGKTWSSKGHMGLAPPTDLELKSIWGIDNKQIWIVGESNSGNTGHLYHWDGKNISAITAPQIGGLLDVWVVPGTKEVWCIGQGGEALHATDGTTWVQKPTFPDVMLLDIHGTTANDIWVVGEHASTQGGVVVHYDGTEWTREVQVEKLASGKSLTGVWASSKEVWVTGGINLRYDVDKKKWSQATLPEHGGGAVWHGSDEVWLERFRQLIK